MKLELKDKELKDPLTFKKPALTCLFKENNYWMYHTQQVENIEEEKANPGEKLWLVIRHMMSDKNYELQNGFQLEIGDTIKFGRVRYKVIMQHSDKHGLQMYNILDRFKI